MSPAPTVLVLGGLGFIGRNFVPYLYENKLASEIRVVDKSLLLTANLNPRQREAFENVEVKQKDLVDPGTFNILDELFHNKFPSVIFRVN
jgi:nucleoside-diphosphate-sugar epimerase